MPEEGWSEFRTTAFIIETLRSYGYEVLTGKKVINPDNCLGRSQKVVDAGIAYAREHGVSEELLAEMQAIWGPGVLPINLPTQNHAHVIDCFEREEGESDIMSVADVHRAFIERIVEEDDEQLERYLEQGSVDPRTLHPLITKALREGHIIPVCFVSAKNLIGIRDFMKVIIRHLPSPAEANEALFVRGDGEPFATKPDKDAPVIAQVFKIVNDPYIGKIGVFRVHQGQITKDSVLYVDDNKKPIKIAHPLILQGKNTARQFSLKGEQ